MPKKIFFLVSVTFLLTIAGAGSADMVAYWDFEGDFGDAIGGNDATPIGDTAIFLDLDRGRVAELDGTGDYMEIPDSASLNISGGELTIATWVYFDDVTGPPEIVIAKPFTVGQHASPYFSYGLHILSNGTPRFWLVTDDAAGNAPGSTNLESGRWYHMAGVYDGNQMILYVDGEVAASRNKTGNITGYDTVLRLGTNGGLTEQMDGRLDDVRIFNHALDQTDLQAVMVQTGEKYPYAMAQSPKDGTIYENTWVNLSWRAGDSAVSHDVYLGDDLAEVNEATRDSSVFRGNLTDTFYVAGFSGFAFPEGLVPGTTYYWRIDEIDDADPNSPWKSDVWSFSIPPKTAYNPNPADGAEFVDPDADLGWTGGYAAKFHTVYLGDDFDDVNNATAGAMSGSTTYKPPSPFESERVMYWRVDEFDGFQTHKGDIWAFTTPGAVGNPQPANSAADVQMTATLSWTPADNAASHELYFGIDADAVKNATTTSPEYVGPRALGAESYDPGGLAWHSSYAWRVDEVYPTATVKGLVWTFTTADFLLVDNFEAYNDIDPPDPASDRIFDKWIDGFGTTTNGALVGNDLPPYAEQGVVRNGAQSMIYRYDNNLKTSEATLTLTRQRDWTAEGVTKLSLWFRGDGTNAAERMFVAVNGNAVVYHDDPAVAQTTAWTEWVIDLTQFAGVDLANVNTISIGFGTKGSPAAGGSGKMYFDDIRLIR